MSCQVPAVDGYHGKKWRAKSWYWKGSGLFLLVAAAMAPLLAEADDPPSVAAASLLLVSPVVFWMWRIAAWEEPTGLAVRNFFGTKRISWDSIEKLEGHLLVD